LKHTPAEIAQQPGTWITTFDRLHHRQTELQNFLSHAGLRCAPQERPVVFLIGAGTSDTLAALCIICCAAGGSAKLSPWPVTSLLTDFPDYVLSGQRYLWISFSRSGDSPEGVAVLERALAECPGISHLLVTCHANGRMNRAVEGRANCLSIVLDDANQRPGAGDDQFLHEYGPVWPDSGACLEHGGIRDDFAGLSQRRREISSAGGHARF